MEFSVDLKNALEMAGQLAARTGGVICTEHLLYGVSAVDTGKANKRNTEMKLLKNIPE